MGDSDPITRGSDVLLGIGEFPNSPLRIVRANEQGWTTVGELPPPSDLRWTSGPVHVAFGEQRVAVRLLPIFERCSLLIYESDSDGWKLTGPLFPSVCSEGTDIAGGAVSLEGERIAIGAYPNPNAKGRAGQVALHERGTGEWAETARIDRPIIEGDYTEDGMLPYAFGHRVHLVGGRLHVGTGYQIIRSQPGSASTEANVINNGVVMLVEEAGQWKTEPHLVHAQPSASFGGGFEVRGDRVFIDSPDEAAVYVFVRSIAGYRMEARLPAEAVDAGTRSSDQGGDTQ